MTNKTKQKKAIVIMPSMMKKNSNTITTSEYVELRKMLANINEKVDQRRFKPSGLGQGILDIGNAAASYIGYPTIFGSGAYSMKQNNMWNTGNQVPQMHGGTNKVTIKHREYIMDVIGASAFSVLAELDINPGLVETFPYLSTIAACFQEYRFKGLVFEYKCQSGMVTGSDTHLGDVMMVGQYRSDAVIPNNKVAMLNEHWSVSTVPSQNVFLPIECDPKENPLRVQYVRTGALTANQDQKFYDLASLILAVVACPANIVGELWVTYDVDFFKPVLPTGGIAYGGLSFDSPTITGVTSGTPFGTSFVPAYNTLSVAKIGDNEIFIPCRPGDEFLILLHMEGTTVTHTADFQNVRGTFAYAGSNTTGSGTSFYTQYARATALTVATVDVYALGGASTPTVDQGVSFAAAVTVVGGSASILKIIALGQLFI